MIKIKYVTLIILILTLAACNTMVGETKLTKDNLLNVEEYQKFYENDEGFLFVSLKTDEKLDKQLGIINDALEKTDSKANTYAVYIPDGKKVVDLNEYPDNPLKDSLGGNTFSYISDGKVIKQLDLTKYDENNLVDEISKFIEEQKE